MSGEAARMRVILDTLWARPGDEVYAVVDAARDPRVYPMVRACGVRHECLYAGAIPRELAAVAPYVVRLWRDHPFTEELLEAGWGKSWGIFAVAPCDVETIRRHLRRFLRVRREGGPTMLFRYYDPRVLRVYLPTCTEEELATFFGPVARFVMEDDEPSRLLAFGGGAGAWSASKVVVGGEAALAQGSRSGPTSAAGATADMASPANA